ncbi:MAG: leucine-rich repeat protein, partial [Clostridia bacterium]|nr:leucine-rich repeat protein [Clostridia bacterium]
SVVTIPVTVEKNALGFLDMQFTVKYDANVLEGITISVPDDSLLVYSPDMRIPDMKEKPLYVSAVMQDKGEMRIALSGGDVTDENGTSSALVFSGTGKLVELTFILKSDISLLENALSQVEILLDEDAFTPFIFRTPDGNAFPPSNVLVENGGVLLTDIPSPESITITSDGLLNQTVEFLSPVSFSANLTSSQCYCIDNTQWYVNDELQNNVFGTEFTFTPSTSGTYSITARNGSAVSNEIKITVEAATIVTPTPAGSEYNGFTYTISNGAATITGYIGTDKEIVIPSSIKGVTVMKIGSGAFKDRTDLIKIEIPFGVADIEAEAFSGCSLLTSITLPQSVSFIQEKAFAKCTNLERVDLLNSFVWLSKNAFDGCEKLNAVYCYSEPPFLIEDDAFSGTAQDFTIYYRSDFSNVWAPHGETEFAGYPIKIFDIDRLLLTAQSTYTVEHGMLLGVKAKTDLSTLLTNFIGGNISVADKAGKVIDINANVGTAYIVRLTNGDEVLDELTIVVSGDINGDAAINSRDIASIQKHILGTTSLETVFAKAADSNNDDRINSRDISTLQKTILSN